jgi:hypothetical protein
MKKLYSGKRINTDDFVDMSSWQFGKHKEVDEIMRESMKSSLVRLVRENNVDPFVNKKYQSFIFLGKSFPDVSEFMKTEEDRLNFVEFLESLAKRGEVILDILMYSKDSQTMVDLLKDFLKDNQGIVNRIMKEKNGGELLNILLENGSLLPMHSIEGVIFPFCQNCPAVDFCLSNGFEVEIEDDFGWNVLLLNLTTDNHLVVDHLLKEGALLKRTLEKARHIKYRSLQVILEQKGDAFIREIPLELILPFNFNFKDAFRLYYNSIEILKRLKVVVPKHFILKARMECVVALMCFGYIRLEELNNAKRDAVVAWIRRNNVKVNAYTLPFLCKEIKERMVMLLLCLNRLYGRIEKYLKFMLLDYIWSQ